jgi:hypothetical protein
VNEGTDVTAQSFAVVVVHFAAWTTLGRDAYVDGDRDAVVGDAVMW